MNLLDAYGFFRRKMYPLICLGISLVITSCSPKVSPHLSGNVPLQFGVIADCQYCKEEGTGVRKYNKSDAKLAACVNHLNTLELDYTIHLGDFIDRDWESFEVVLPIYNQLAMPHHHVLGNHDFSVRDEKKSRVREEMGLPHEYYDFSVKGWRFVVLNGNDISFHAYPEHSEGYELAEKYYVENGITSPKWNGAIGRIQLDWLRAVLVKACSEKEKVALYCHFPVFPENVHNLWNATEVIAMLEEFPCVQAYMNGHNHEGNYGYKNGIHYLTFKGMVDTDESAYGIVKINQEYIEVVGEGREESRKLQIRK